MSANTESAEPISGEVVAGESLDEKAARRRANRPVREPRESNRPTVNDRQDSKEAKDAAVREAIDEDGLIECHFGEGEEAISVRIDPAEFDLDFQLMVETGAPAKALLKVLGGNTEEGLANWKKVARLSALNKDLENIIQSFAKQCGMGNS